MKFNEEFTEDVKFTEGVYGVVQYAKFTEDVKFTEGLYTM